MTMCYELVINIHLDMTEPLNDIWVLTGYKQSFVYGTPLNDNFVWTGYWQSLCYYRDIKWYLGVNTALTFIVIW